MDATNTAESCYLCNICFYNRLGKDIENENKNPNKKCVIL
jgi:hypothetical protein